MPNLITKGVDITGLLKGKIFCFNFDYDEWPSTHSSEDYLMRPFNGSLFDLRTSYSHIFSEAEYAMQDHEEYDSSKVFKITYTINMLSCLEMYAIRDPKTNEISYINEGVSLMELAVSSGELDIFDSENF